MQPVPDRRTEKTKDISNNTRNHDEHNRRHRIEWFDEVHRLDHVRPENKIEDRLRPADENKNRPNHMPTGDYQPNLIGIGHTRCSLLAGLTGASAGRSPRSEFGG
jgi:hypothetical protein